MLEPLWLQKELEANRDNPLYIHAGLMIELAESLYVHMQDSGMSEAELADKIGRSPQYITKLLNGTYDFTLETLIKIATALDLDLKVEFTPKKKAGKKKAKYNYEHPVKKVAER